MEDSYLTLARRGKKNYEISSYIGPDATHLFRARMLVMSLKMLQKNFRLTRSATPTKMLSMAAEFTGKKYKRGEYSQAIDDVQIWVNTMECALPMVLED